MFYYILQALGINMSVMVLNIVTGILLARFLGPTLRGELAAAQTFPNILCGLALLGLPEAVVYWISREPENSKQTIVTTLYIFIPIILIVLIIGYFLAPFFLHIQPKQVIFNARLYLLSIFSMSFGSIYVWGFQGFQHFKNWNLLRLFNGVLWLIAIICGRTFGVLSNTYLIVFMLIVPLPFIPLFMLNFWRFLKGTDKPSLACSRQLLGYGLPISISALPQVMNLRLDQLLMAAVVAPKILGYYVIGVTWSGLSSIIFNAVGSVLFPKMATASDPLERNRILETTSRTSVLIAFIVVIPQLLLTPVVLPLFFGRAFSPAVPAAIILVIAGGFIGLNTVFRNILNGLGHPNSLLYAEIIGLAVTAALLAVLLRPYLILGAAITSLLSYSITFCYLCASVKRYTQSSLVLLIMPRMSDVSFAVLQFKKAIFEYGLARKPIKLPADLMGKS